MPVNITSIKTSSNGAWQGDNPLEFAFPLLIVQTVFILILSRLLAFLLKPLRQPKVIAEIVGGILLGPSAFGRNLEYLHTFFPKWSLPILESVASIGLLFFLFLVGLELDLSSMRRSGKRAVSIAAAGISVPFICGIGVAFVFRKTIDGADKVGYAQYLVFMGVALSITAFPVLARILAELKLLTTSIGETAMAAAAFNDIAAWILLALAVALAGDGNGGSSKSPLVSVWVLLSGAAFVAFMMIVIRPGMKWVASKCSPEQDSMDEFYIVLTLAGVMVSGFITDVIGIHSIFGAFVFGLTIPKGGDFADRLIERIEDFVTGLLLPLYFASSGLKTDVTKIKGGKSWGLLVLVITTACAGKIFGTFVVALMCMMPVRESLTLGLLMNTKGLVELIVLNIGKEKKVLNDEAFAILVLMALFTTFMTTPSVMAIYKPARRGNTTVPRDRRKLRDVNNASVSSPNPKDELRLLACVHGPGNVPSLISFIESTRSTTKAKLKLYVMHMVELTERTSSIMMVQKFRKNGLPFISRRYRRGEVHDRVAMAFQAYGQLGQVSLRPSTAISALSTMHEDVCHVAEEKLVSMIILPFHKLWMEGEAVDNMGHGWRAVNQRVLKNAPCSVGILVDRGFGGQAQTPGPNPVSSQRVCVLFFGGPDDREALELGGMMSDHPTVKVTVVRFVNSISDDVENKRRQVTLRPSPHKSTDESYSFSVANVNREFEKEQDDAAVSEFRAKWSGIADITEMDSSSVVDSVLAIGQSGDYDLVIVGKGRFPSTMVAELADREAEHAELGPIGDMLASANHGIVSSVLVVQQHDLDHMVETAVSKVLTGYEDSEIVSDASTNV
ncbi:unnamed protein product [Rhodiola kirilowii]